MPEKKEIKASLSQYMNLHLGTENIDLEARLHGINNNLKVIMETRRNKS